VIHVHNHAQANGLKYLILTLEYAPMSISYDLKMSLL